MGHGSYDASDHARLTRSYVSRSTDEIFTQRRIDAALDPKSINIRESRDNVDHPESNAIIIALDVTGSMKSVLDYMARQGLQTTMEELYNRIPVSDPQIMVMAVGDLECDKAPLQVTQFESDIRIATWLEKLYIEQGGGGNGYESYTLPWLFAAQRTVLDCVEKRNKKGYIFTIGDEPCPPILYRRDLNRHIGGEITQDYSAQQILALAQEKYNIFHLIVEQGSCGRSEETINSWMEVLGQNTLRLDNKTNMAQTIVSAIQISEGMSYAEVEDSWSGAVRTTVRHAFNMRR